MDGATNDTGVDAITRVRFKVCIVGDRAVGKTSLLNRYVYNYFDPAYRGTLGASLRYLNVRESVGGRHLVEAETAYFDLMGETHARDNFKDIFFWGTNGFLAVADVTRPETVRALPDWIYAVQGVAGNVPYRILINKADLPLGAAVSPQTTAALLEAFREAPYHLTSAKTGQGVERAFDALTDEMVAATLQHAKVKRQTRIVGDRILAFAERRGALGLATVEQISPSAFRLRITQKGERELERILAPERVSDANE